MIVSRAGTIRLTNELNRHKFGTICIYFSLCLWPNAFDLANDYKWSKGLKAFKY